MAPTPPTTRTQRLRSRLAVLLPAILLLGAVAGTGIASAADTISMTVNVSLAPRPAFGVTMSTTAKPTYVGYTVSFANDQNKSTLTQLRLNVAAPTASAGSVTAAGIYHATYPNGDGACAPSGSGVLCTIAQLKPGAGFTRTIVFRTPAFDAALIDVPLTFPAASTTLAVKEGTGDAGARSDTFDAAQTLSTPLRDVVKGTGGDEQDFFSTYTLPTGGPASTSAADLESNVELLGTGNKQGTKVIVPTTNRGTETTLEEKASGLCPTEACFGQLSQLTIPGLAGSDTVVVFVRWDDSAIPSGITQRNLRVAWDKSDVGTDWVIVTATCNNQASNAPCRYPAVRFKDKDLGVKVVLPHNGVIRGL